MKLDFKPVVAGDIEKLKPFYGLRPNKACDSVFLDCFLWKDYYCLSELIKLEKIWLSSSFRFRLMRKKRFLINRWNN